MSSINIKTTFALIIILVMLFGVGLGYELNSWFGTQQTSKTSQNSSNTNSVRGNTATSNPQQGKNILTRTGTITTVNSSTVVFNTYAQNQDSTYSALTMTAKVDDKTTLTKIDLKNPLTAATTIALSDLKPNSEISVETAENMYGKTIVTAKSIQLHIK